MSLKQIAAEKYDELRVARLYGRNAQLFGDASATAPATDAQRIGLKALAANDSERNHVRNHGATTTEKHAQLLPPETPPKVARVAHGFSGGCTPVALPENQPVPMSETDPVPDTFTTEEAPPVLSFRPIINSGDHQPANDPTPSPSGGGMTVTDRQRAFLKREPLVTEEDLHLIQAHLLRHLAICRDCCVEDHLYCRQAERTGNGYTAYLTEFPDADMRHADFVSAVIKARIWGIKRGFTELDALAHQREETGRETAGRPVYGIDARPTELAFVNHFTGCTFCYPRSGKYCEEGRELHRLAMMETLQ